MVRDGTREMIESAARELGFDKVGFTTLGGLKPAEDVLQDWIDDGRHGEMKYLENFNERRDIFLADFPEAKSVVVLGVNYFSKDEEVPEGRGRIARYARGKDYHTIIAEKHGLLITRLKEVFGEKVLAKSCVDARPVPERFAAVRAGFGFIGKNTMMLSRQFGPWLFLSEIITNLELEESAEAPGTCGTCVKCQDVCPTGALDEDYNIDARLCIAYLTIEHKGIIPRELRPKMKDWVFGCDECLTVCPFTTHQQETTWADLRPEKGVGASLNFDQLFSLSANREYKETFAGTALLRANRKQMLRNACIVLGNTKSPKALPYLQKALQDSSNLVRLHAVWALGQLNTEEIHQILSEHAQIEKDQDVLEEIGLVIGAEKS